MDTRERIVKSIRWFLGLLLVVAGLSTTWAWGEVARLAGPGPTPVEAPPVALYAAWQADSSEQANLYRSIDKGESWQPLALPEDARPVAWADNGRQHVAAILDDGLLILSEDQGETWMEVQTDLSISSLIWSDRGDLYLGTDGHGVYRLTTEGAIVATSMMKDSPVSDPIVSLSLIDGRLFAATPNAIVHTDDTAPTAGQVSWTMSTPLPDLARMTSITATDKQTVYAGTQATGLYRSIDAGQTWQQSANGLGQAAGLMVRIAALRADPEEAGVLYAAVDHLVGSTHVHASAAGVFVTVDNGVSWQPLAGPSFPEARHASSLVLIAGKPLNAGAVTAEGLQGYAPDVMRILAALESNDPIARASAARQLGMAGPMGVWNKLLAALDDPDPAVRLVAADALGRIDDPAAVPGLLIAINHPSEQVRLGSARALGMMQVEAAVEPLRAMLLQGEGLETSTAAEALGRIGGKAATEALLATLADSEPTGRWHVAMAALEQMGEPAVSPLVTMLDSQDASARRNAAQALGWIGSSSATEALVHILKRDGDGDVRAQAAWALGEIGDPAARRALERAQMRDSAVEVQAAAEWALSRVPLHTEANTDWAAHWAPALNQLQPVRWLVLALSLAGGAWLMMGTRSRAAIPLRLRHRHR
jgi:HEAT repeat protein